MNICVDTRVLEEIAGENKKQKDWFYSSLTNPSVHIFLPTIVISEFVCISMRKRSFEEAKNLVDSLKAIPKLNIMGLSSEIAIESGKLQWQHKIGIGDCIVAATAKIYKCEFVRTDHKDFDKISGIRRSW